MDPMSCWLELCECMADGNWDGAAARAEALIEWDRRLGFRPDAIPREVWDRGEGMTALQGFVLICRSVE